jgi:hypothetical protein
VAKTARILGHLPSTFAVRPGRSALAAAAGAVGDELLRAENSLAAVMMAHWVDRADLGAEVIDDLRSIAALYGLAPREDETVEEFRVHVKRYVRTLLGGTVTVQGILRVTAEALALDVADTPPGLDPWWTRPDEELVTVHPGGEDAATRVLGLPAAGVRGAGERRAEVTGVVELGGGADLRDAPLLRLRVDGQPMVEVDLAAGAADPAVTLAEIVQAVDAAVPGVAAEAGPHLLLASPTVGPAGSLEVQDGPGDAAEAVLGLAPRAAQGRPATPARVVGQVDLGGTVDLRTERFLRVAVDDRVAEVDCAAADAAHTGLDHVCQAVNDALGFGEVASHDGGRLSLRSPTSGPASRVELQRPAAQDATARLFGPAPRLATGQADAPARLLGRRVLPDVVDLRGGASIELRVDGGAAALADCAGADPAATRPEEITAAINAAAGAQVAFFTGGTLRLISTTTGPGSELALGAPDGDASGTILGIGPRAFAGHAATGAVLVGQADLSNGVDLRAAYRLRLAVDDGPVVDVDLRSEAGDPGAATLAEIAAAVNAALPGPPVAAPDGPHLRLASPSTGTRSAVAVFAVEHELRRRFVTRATIVTEAAQALLGFVARQAAGTPATRAEITGQADLSPGVDLREASFLRLAVDGGPAKDVDCSGARPRATTLGEVVAKLQAEFPGVASDDGLHLVLASQSSGKDSRLVVEPALAADALDHLLGVEPVTVRGEAPTGVSLVGTVELGDGVDLSAGDRIVVTVDDQAAREVACAGADPANTTLDEVVAALNTGLAAPLARRDGRRVRLSSPTTGVGSRLRLEDPPGGGATLAIFGVVPPREYVGGAEAPARITGTSDLSGPVDLSVRRFLRVTVDRGEAAQVDCAAGLASPEQATLEQLVDAINSQLGDGVAAPSDDGDHLVLTSKLTGPTARLAVEHATARDAAAALLGDAEREATGSDGGAAVLVGEVDLLAPVDLSQRSRLRLAVDGGQPVEVDVAGAVPAATSLDEVVAALDRVLPGLAAATDDDRLQLSSPSTGAGSRLEVLPLRFLEVVEHPESPAEHRQAGLRHGDGWTVANDGAADASVAAELTAPLGVAGAGLANEALGWQVRLLAAVPPGWSARLWRGARKGLRAALLPPGGPPRPLAAGDVLVGPAGAQAVVPTTARQLVPDPYGGDTLHLVDPLAANVVTVRSRRPIGRGEAVSVAVVEHDLAAAPAPVPDPDGRTASLSGRLRAGASGVELLDAAGAVVARLGPGPAIDPDSLTAHHDRVVRATGPLHAGDPPRIAVDALASLFDVMITGPAPGATPERYPAATIGAGAARPDALAARVSSGPEQSGAVVAGEADKATVLVLTCGRPGWRYLECAAARFGSARLDQARFAGGPCREVGVFGASCFALVPAEPVEAVFGPVAAPPDAAVEVRFAWPSHPPGAFTVNLPADLPSRFGGRFNLARFGTAAEPELFPGAVTEPADDPDHLVTLVNARPSDLVVAAPVPIVPIGWAAVTMPFRRPQRLTLGAAGQAAQLYLTEEGLDGFIRLSAKAEGAWGNAITVTARPAGPARYDITVAYDAGRFDSARQIVLGPPLEPASALEPGQLGLLQAKAAGVRAAATRDQNGPWQ